MLKKWSSIVRLANLTRRFERYKQPLRYELCRWLLKRLCRKGTCACPGNLVIEYDEGLINVSLESDIEYEILFHGYYEPHLARLIRAVVQPGAACLDIGANIGCYTLVMAFAAGSDGKVVALEPHPGVAERLSENVALNRLRNVSIVRAALWHSDGVATLHSYEPGSSKKGISSLKASESARHAIEVPTVSGKALEEKFHFTSLDLIKIDVEGAEMVALQELSDLIETHRPSLIIEYRRQHWERFGSSIEDALGMLRDWRYTVYAAHHGLTTPLEQSIPNRCDLFCTPAAETPTP